MPPNPGAKDDELGDVYELLGVDEDASEKDINGAFRKGSLKCHPDRNPDDPEAAEKFDRLSRAKELLLDPTRRAEFDRKRKAKHDLDQRHAEEDEKRRRLREELEGREGRHAAACAAASEAASLAEARKKFAQMDYASRIRAKEAELAGKQAEVAAVAAKARSTAEEARVRLRWREPGNTVGARIEAVEKVLADFDVRGVTLEGDLEAVVQLGSREDALRAVITCRERRQQMPFRVMLDKTAGPPAKVVAEAPSRSREYNAAAAERPAPKAVKAFDDWEAKMLESLRGLAEAQKSVKAQPAGP